MENVYSLLDIVVFDGCITTFGVIAPLVRDMDNVRLANDFEISLYNNRPER